MTIITKADVGDIVWFMADNMPQSGTLKRTYISIESKSFPNISYTVEYGANGRYNYNGSQIFNSKKELIETL